MTDKLDQNPSLHKCLPDRLRVLLDKHDTSVETLAKGLNVSRQACYKWLKHGQITDNNLLAVANFFKVSPQWLKYGIDIDMDDCSSHCGIKTKLVNLYKTQALVWELDSFQKTLLWYGDSLGSLGRRIETPPESMAKLLEWIPSDYHEVFLSSIKRFSLNNDQSATLIPLHTPCSRKPLWVNSNLYTTFGNGMVLGSFSVANVVVKSGAA